MKSFDDIYTAIGRVLPPPCLLILHNNIDKVIRQSSKHRNTLESYRKQKKQSCVTINCFRYKQMRIMSGQSVKTYSYDYVY